MSRIGRSPIELPAGVSVSISPGRVMVNGPLGELAQDVPARMKVEQDDGTITVTRPTDRGEDRALHGLTRSLVANMVEGVTRGFERRLEIQGVGYRASLPAKASISEMLSLNEKADNLRKYGGYIPGIRPGPPTAQYLDRVLSRLTLPGSLFLAAVAVLPSLFIAYGGFSQASAGALGGTSVLIAVGVALDTMRQMESQMMMRSYEGFLK